MGDQRKILLEIHAHGRRSRNTSLHSALIFSPDSFSCRGSIFCVYSVLLWALFCGRVYGSTHLPDILHRHNRQPEPQASQHNRRATAKAMSINASKANTQAQSGKTASIKGVAWSGVGGSSLKGGIQSTLLRPAKSPNAIRQPIVIFFWSSTPAACALHGWHFCAWSPKGNRDT